MSAAPRLCLDCGNPTPRGHGSRCPACRPAHAARRKAEGATGARGSTRQWRQLRAKVLARDCHICTRCGSVGQLEVHHIDGDARHNATGNLMTLCRPCHQGIERLRASGGQKQDQRGSRGHRHLRPLSKTAVSAGLAARDGV